MPPPITLEFRRHRHRGDTLHCHRADGSQTWTALQYNFALHDLAHFAVELELGFTTAFYGILAMGHAIEEFEAPRAQRPLALQPANLSAQALQTEHLVNLLLTELNYGGRLPGFREQLNEILQQDSLPSLPELTEARLDRIRAHFRELRVAWGKLADGESLRLRLFDAE